MNQLFDRFNRRIGVMLSLLILSFTMQAQTPLLKLVDEDTRQSVENANYAYGSKQGISSIDGEITFVFQKDVPLIISHIQYGKLSFTPEEVSQAMKKQVLELSAKSHSLQPVTLISIHPQAGKREKMAFRVQHQLAHDAGQILEQFSSISSIRKSGAYGFDPVLRGFKYDQINLVIDGSQGATAGCPNRMDPASSQIPLNMITQAEVMKGPHSLRYGNAFGGTINFKSAPARFSEKATIQGRLGTSYATNGEISRSEAVIGLTSKATDLKLFGSLSTGKEYTDGDNMEIPAEFYRTNVGGKMGLKISETQTMSLLLSNNYAKDVDFPALPMDLRKDDTWLVNLGHKALFYNGALSSWNTTVYATKVDHLMDNHDKMMNPRMVDANTAAQTNNAGGRTELRFDFEKDWLYAGTGMRVENAEGTRERNILMGLMAGKTILDNVWQDALIRKNSAFAEYHHQGDAYHLVFSGRLELNHAEARELDENFASNYSNLNSDILNPALSLGGTKTLTNNISFSLWMGMAQRSGSLAERYINLFPIGLDPYEMLGNPGLKAETNNQLDLIFDYKTEQTNATINLFASFLSNYISSEIRNDLQPRMATAAGVRQFINIDDARISGLEISWQQLLGTHFQQVAELAYTHGENTTTNEALPEIPPMEFRYRLLGSFVKKKLRTELHFRHAFEQNRIATSYGETKTPAFNRIDLKASYTLTQQLHFSVAAQNLFDEAYYEHLSRSVRSAENRPLYSPGRSFYFSLSYNFL
ncbi:TonB-dependent receptor domain-containing protein [Sunxiuqinia sp. sy24]|uniref:TonB-dependent receptor domain-containing protein n=1 Tax=Sunxiuqinia sp. sy24 TaxID=3461495 RepID=UPI0040454C5E